MMQATIRWLRVNLLSNFSSAVLSLALIGLCAWASWSLLSWAIWTAQWQVIGSSMRVLMAGTYPVDSIWRAWVSALVLFGLSGATLGMLIRLPRVIAVGVGLVSLLIALLSAGSMLGLSWGAYCVLSGVLGWALTAYVPVVRRVMGVLWLIGVVLIGALLAEAGTERWGGLLLSVLVTLVAAVLSLPVGILLALGRRSRYSSARVLCAGYIEVMRALPLILVVYCLWIMTPFIVPSVNVPDLARGVLGFSLFFSAYVAEYIRSGLQSVPRGQVEAAQALGMSNWHINRDIVLPQALRVTTPALVGNVLDIFNNVPLLFIIGLTDFLRAGQMVMINPQTAGRTYEIYIFMFIVYMAVASIITYGCRRLEDRMNQGGR
ncbi:MAG: amino acid ABC transporter permease [Burkholderiaceae bacterium]|nr:amino acid ABC transporter permease [Burkholderiaceae bacterium]